MKLLLIFVSLMAADLYAANQAIVLTINQSIGPATESYILHSLQYAANQQAAIVIIRIDTPGGLDTAISGIDKAILASPIPVIAYVSPSGARVANVGTFILYASGMAAMAPGTSIGSANAVIATSSSVAPSLSVKNAIDEKNLSPLEHKAANNATANIRGLAFLHQRNATWAELAVRYSVSLNAEDALKLNVVNRVAMDIPDLLRQLKGRSVMTQGRLQQLQTATLVIQEVPPGWRYQFLAAITNPNLAYILLLLGIYGVFFILDSAVRS